MIFFTTIKTNLLVRTMSEQIPLFTNLNNQNINTIDIKNIDPSLPKNQISIEAISGLRYIENYITEEKQKSLIKNIDEEKWLDDLKRRVQHYGYKYDYKARRVKHDMHIGKLPDWLKDLSEELHNDGFMHDVADQVIVNEYQPGQGIAPHIDCEPCFEHTIASLSLGSDCIMDFTNKEEKTKIPVWLSQKSLVVLSGEARKKWLHGIAARKSDVKNSIKYDRCRRISLTFRKVIVE